MKISRMFEMIYLLLERKTMTANELAERFEVSPRTIYRDVEALSQAGIPIYADRGRGGGIHLMEDFVLDKSLLSESEQREVLESLQSRSAVFQEKEEPALQKLSALFGKGRENWIQIDFGEWNPNSVLKERLELLKGAVLNRESVRFTYSGANGKTEEREVEPVQLVFRGYDWYLLAWCRARRDFRYFKLTRMTVPELTGDHFQQKKLPKPEQPAAQRGKSEAPEIQVKAAIDPQMAYRVYDEFPPESRSFQEDGRFLVQIKMTDQNWIYQYLMSYGGGLEVLEPPEVRAELEKRLRQALEKNKT